MKVNGQTIEGDRFAFDGCHKIYIIESDAEEDDAGQHGYGILPISDLPAVYENSCGLRFISNWALNTQYVEQCADEVVFDVEDEHHGT